MSENLPIPPPPQQSGDSDFPDIFLSYRSSDRESVQVVRNLLKQRGVNSFFDQTNLIAGVSWIDGLESALSRVRAVAVFLGRDGLGTWQKREMSLALDRQAREETHNKTFPVIPVLLPQTDLEHPPAFLLLGTWIDLRNGLEDPLAIDTLASAAKGEPFTPTAVSLALPPYLALRSFREEDAQLFFGREAFVDSLLNKVLSRPFVAVLGPSGSGKSSTVQAGLFPLLRRQRPPAPTWDIITFRPGKRPFHSLAASLVSIWAVSKSKTDILIEAEKLGNGLAKGEVRLEETLNLAIEKSPRTDRLLLVVDQFEELFTLTPEAERLSFVSLLVAQSKSPLITTLITMRADFYGQALALSRELSDLMQEGVINLGPMKRDELLLSIVKPAERVGLRFESGLVERILDHVENQPGNLPLLEYALTELWAKREGDLLRNKQYDAIGGVGGAITQRAETLFQGLSVEQQRVAARTFTRLVRVSAANEEGTDSRQRVTMNSLDEPAREVIRSFVSARLLVVDRNPLINEEIVEVAHEALISGWKRLRDLVDQDREFLLWRQRLGVLADQWQQTGRERVALLRGSLLQEAKRWLSNRAKELSKTEQEFIVSSSRLQASATRWRQRVAAAALILVLAVIGGILGWKKWTETDAYQVKQVISRAPGLIGSSDEISRAPDLLGEGTSDEGTIIEWFVTLTLVGKADDALTGARKLENKTHRNGVLAHIAIAMAQLGKIEESYALAEEIDDQRNKASAFGGIALTLADHKQFEPAQRAAANAVTAVSNIKDLEERERIFTYHVLDGLLKLGLFDQALAKTAEIAASGTDASGFVSLHKISLALAQEGRVDDAHATASKITTMAPRINTSTDLAKVSAKLNKTEAARRAAWEAIDTARMLEQRINTFTDVAKVSAKLNKTDAAKRAVMEAYNAARMLDQPTARISSLAKIAVLFGDIREVDAATKVAEEALNAARDLKETSEFDKAFKAKALSEVVIAFTNIGNTKNVTSIVDAAKALIVDHLKLMRRPGSYPDYDSVASLIVALAKTGRLNEAFDLPFGNDETRAEILREAADSVLQEGMRDESLVIIRAIAEPSTRTFAFIENAKLSLNVQKTEDTNLFIRDAIPAARQISEPRGKATTLVNIAEVLLKIGQTEEVKALIVEAQPVAGQVPELLRGDVLFPLATLNANVHRYRTALEIADQCIIADQRLSAYITILQAYGREHDQQVAKLLDERDEIWETMRVPLDEEHLNRR